MRIYERIYDNPFNKDGSKKPNVLLGDFQLLQGDMNDYSYQVYVQDIKDKQVYILEGIEVSYDNGGTKHYLTKIEECPDVQAYLKFCNSPIKKRGI